MSINYFHNNPPKLHSPLLEGLQNKRGNQKTNEIKKTYYNPNEENKPNESIDHTLDSTLFTSKNKTNTIIENDSINQNSIATLLAIIKICSIFIIATGGMLSLLELINIIRTIYSGSYSFGNSLIVFTSAFIGTVLATLACHGFLHLAKTIKYVYLNTEEQKTKIDRLLNFINSK